MEYYQQCNSVSWTELDGEIVCLKLETGIYVGLKNLTAKTLWLLLEKPQLQSELVRSIVTEYDVKQETAEQDVNDFLKQLLEAGLIAVQR